MPPPNAPLCREVIVATAEEVIRRFGPERATVVDVARALGVSHAAVYRHVATKAELRALVVERWVEATMSPLRAVAETPTPALDRLGEFMETLISSKRRRFTEDPELFAAYRTLAADAESVVTAHVEELVRLIAVILADGVAEGAFRLLDPESTAQAILYATVRFHHPAHASEWSQSNIDDALNDVWQLLLNGLRPLGTPG